MKMEQGSIEMYGLWSWRNMKWQLYHVTAFSRK